MNECKEPKDRNVLRKESLEKVYGQSIYANDIMLPRMLHAAMKLSPHAHARILELSVEKAKISKGVRAVLTGEDFKNNIGLYLCDKPLIARDVVRHHKEVVAVVIADTYENACRARDLIEVKYERLDPLLSPKDSMKPDAPLLHPDMDTYGHIEPIHPKPGTNVANHTRIRKGDVTKGQNNSSVVVETEVDIPIGDHVAMEPRVAIAEIKKSGEVRLISSTQAPFVVKGLMSVFFGIEAGKIVVEAPLLGGGFGGKAGIQLEALAYLCSLKTDGLPVKIVNTREEDMATSPGHIGLYAKVKMGANEDGKIQFMELDYWFNSGAYADYAVNVSRAAGISCTGPYYVPNIRCDSLCVYTNLPFSTAYRGFGHIEMAFAIERALDVLAKKMNVDPYVLRRKNGIKKGDTTPVQSVLGESTGDICTCFDRVNESLGGSIGKIERIGPSKVRVKGISGLWKAPAMPTNTDAGAILTFNQDGSCNLHTGIVEMGQGTKTGLAQLVSCSLGIPVEKVHVQMSVDTKIAPSDWATAASRGLFMAGIATLEACDDAKEKIKNTASQVLRVAPRELVIENERVFVEEDPHHGLAISEVALGYVYPNGNAICGQIIGTGRYIARGLTDIDEKTGKGHPDLEWTMGAEGVEIEVDEKTGAYRVCKAICCIDVGNVINPQIARGQIVGGMAMGMSYTTTEGFQTNSRGQLQNGDLRGYKITRWQEAPEYEVIFLKTPQKDGPLGARGLGEQSVIGMPGAIANALSRATGVNMNQIPILPQRVWEGFEMAKKENQRTRDSYDQDGTVERGNPNES